MSVLEKSVLNLAGALEKLESTLEARVDDLSASSDIIAAAQRQAAGARQQTENAGRGVAAAISDIKALLAADDEAQSGGSDGSAQKAKR